MAACRSEQAFAHRSSTASPPGTTATFAHLQNNTNANFLSVLGVTLLHCTLLGAPGFSHASSRLHATFITTFQQQPIPSPPSRIGAELLQQSEGRLGVGCGCLAQRLAQIEKLAAHRQQVAGRRQFGMDLPVDMQHRRRAHFVAGVAIVLLRQQAGKGVGGYPGHAGVDEQRQLAAFEIEGVLDLQLEIGQQFDPGRLQRIQAGQQVRGDGIVAPTGVAVAENQDGLDQTQN